MKKKVGELYDKPIVIGNPNEFTKNEIALDELGGSFDDGMEYYELLSPTFIDDDEEEYSIGNRINSFLLSVKTNNKILYHDVYSSTSIPMVGDSFCTSSILLKNTKTLKQLLNDAIAPCNLNDASKFRRVTAKEYYS